MTCYPISSLQLAGLRRRASRPAAAREWHPVTAISHDAAVRYVLGRRTATGGFCFYRTPDWGVDEPSAPDTLAALESLRLLGQAPPCPEQTIEWLRSLQNQDGSYPTLPIGWSVLRALTVLEAQPARAPHDWLAALLARVLNGPPVREWRTVVCELLEIVELLPLVRLTISQQQNRSLAALLAAARTPGSGWTCAGVELESTAAGVHVLQALGLAIEDRSGVEQLLSDCEDEALGLRMAPAAAATSAGALEAGLTLAQALGIGLRYPDAIASSIALLQGKDGGLAARHRAISTLHDTWLGVRAEQLLHDLQEERP